MALIAPGIQVHGGKENALRAVENDSPIREVAGNAKARSEVVLVNESFVCSLPTPRRSAPVTPSPRWVASEKNWPD